MKQGGPSNLWEELPNSMTVWYLSSRVTVRMGLGLVVLIAFFCRPIDSPRAATLRTKWTGIAESAVRFRAWQGRLTDFSYRPLGPPPQRLPVRFFKAVRKIKSEVSPRFEAFWVDGLSSLVVNNVIEAVRKLEAAHGIKSREPRLLSDLACLYIERGESDPYYFLLAASAARKALDIDGSLLEAQFNLAVALEHLYLTDMARREWWNYLEQDMESGWASEARSHLIAISNMTEVPTWLNQSSIFEKAAFRNDRKTLEGLLKAHPQQALDYIEEHLFGKWAEATVLGHSELAEKELKAARAAGEALMTQNRDALVYDVVQLIQRKNTKERGLLAEAHLVYLRARDLYRGGRYAAAAVAFLESARGFSRARSPMALRSYFFQGACAHHRASYSEASLLFEHLRSRIVQNYPLLIGQINWAFGLTEYIRGKPHLALDAYLAALASFEDAGDLQSASLVSNLASEALDMMGDTRADWVYRFRALQGMTHLEDARGLRNVLLVAALSAMEERGAEVALYFQNSAVEAARQSGDPLALSEALLWKSRLLLEIGEEATARRILQAAETIATRVTDGEVREYTQANILLVAGEARITSDPGSALKFFDKARAYYRLKDNRNQLWRVHNLISLAFYRAGQLSEAKRHLDQALLILYEARDGIDDSVLRTRYLDRFSELFDAMVRLNLENRDFANAFYYADTAKSRGLLADTGISVPVESNGSAIQSIVARLPKRAILVEYHLLPEQLATFVIRENKLYILTQEVSASKLGEMVERFLVAIRRNDIKKIREIGSALYYILVPDVIQDDISSHAIVFVPHGPLHRLPFAALTISKSGKYMIEENGFVTSPSALFFLRAQESWASKVGGPITVLAVADSAFNRARSPNLVRLSQSAIEAQEVARLNDRSVLLVDKKATKGAFLAAAKEVDILHIAVHFKINVRAPEFSSMLLAPDPLSGDSGILYASDLEKELLTPARLAVLAGCATGIGRIGESGGSSSMARTFLVAGVPLVLASTWAIADSASTDIFIEFHKGLREGVGPVAALQRAQIKFLRSSNADTSKPGVWASLQLIGGLTLD